MKPHDIRAIAHARDAFRATTRATTRATSRARATAIARATPRGRTRARATALPALAICCALLSPPAAAAEAVSPLPASDYTVRPACAAPTPGDAGCLALQLVPQTAAARAHTHPLGMTQSAPVEAGKATTTVCEPPTAAESCYGLTPQDLHSAYQLPTTAPTAQTVALVDAYNDPNAAADLATYDEQLGLPPFPTCAHGATTGCFEQVNQNGEANSPPFPATNEAREAEEATCANEVAHESTVEKEARELACHEVAEADGWAVETSTDVEVAHAVCQSCRILLVEADTASFPELEIAERTASRLGAGEISDSWGSPERGVTVGEDDSSAFNQRGVVITAAAGDDGYLDWDAEKAQERGLPDYPASSPHVVAVGGTHLSLTVGAKWAGEAVWNGDGATGGGCSTVFTAQLWQQNMTDWPAVGCGTGIAAKRAVADVAADGDPYTGAAVYDTTGQCEYEEADGNVLTGPWCTIGGTSLASPIIASVFALAGGSHGVAYPAETLYENEIAAPSSLHDVTQGSNGKCSKPFAPDGLSGCSTTEEATSSKCAAPELICLASSGYDGPSGVGTPNGITAFQPAPETSKPQTKAEEEAGTPGNEAGSGGGHENSSGSGSGSGGAGSSAASGVSSGDNPSALTPTPTNIGAPPAPMLSALALTPSAIVALSHHGTGARARPQVAKIAFAFTMSAAARVHVTLARQIAVAHGHTRWRTLPDTLTIAAARGHDRAHLSAHGTLAPGRYRLALTPAHGLARTLTFLVG